MFEKVPAVLLFQQGDRSQAAGHCALVCDDRCCLQARERVAGFRIKQMRVSLAINLERAGVAAAASESTRAKLNGMQGRVGLFRIAYGHAPRAAVGLGTAHANIAA